jgi:transposase
MNIPNHHIARVISFFVDGLDLTDFYTKYQSARGAAAYNPKMMLKMILFAYSRQTTSGTKIQAMAEENIPMKWLIGDPDLIPDARTINRFRSAPQTGDLIKFMYLQFRQFLQLAKLIDDEYIFIDGTKIVADANKYTFVWRRAIDHFEPVLDQKANDLFEELLQHEANFDTHAASTDLLERMNLVVSELDERIEALCCAARYTGPISNKSGELFRQRPSGQ